MAQWEVGRNCDPGSKWRSTGRSTAGTCALSSSIHHIGRPWFILHDGGGQWPALHSSVSARPCERSAPERAPVVRYPPPLSPEPGALIFTCGRVRTLLLH